MESTIKKMGIDARKLIVIWFVIALLAISGYIGWSVFQFEQCRSNTGNTFWFCVGHL